MRNIKTAISATEVNLDIANDEANEAMDYSPNGKAIKSLVAACVGLLRIVEEQQKQIERLERDSAPLVKPQPKDVKAGPFSV